MKTQNTAISELDANLKAKSALRELTAEETLQCSGGDNPGMGPYDGNGDQSLPGNCEWLDNGRVSCTFG
jgi:hypothetical protein